MHALHACASAYGIMHPWHPCAAASWSCHNSDDQHMGWSVMGLRRRVMPMHSLLLPPMQVVAAGRMPVAQLVAMQVATKVGHRTSTSY